MGPLATAAAIRSWQRAQLQSKAIRALHRPEQPAWAIAAPAQTRQRGPAALARAPRIHITGAPAGILHLEVIARAQCAARMVSGSGGITGCGDGSCRRRRSLLLTGGVCA